MSSFDIVHKSKNHFVKNNEIFLKSMMGYTDLLPLWIADMDFKVADAITEEIHTVADRGIYSYEFVAQDVFKAISSWNKERHDLELLPKSFIQVTTGVLTALAIMIQELTEEGENILIQTPVYHQFQKVIEMNGRQVVENPLELENGKYTMDLTDLEKKFKATGTKLMILCNPHNPVGRVWKRTELQELMDLAHKYGVLILSDEIHSDIVYEGSKFNSIASFKEGRQHITILGSPAKTFGMHSIANGFLYTENETIFNKIHTKVEAMYLHHGNAISAYATIAAYEKGGKWVDDLVEYLTATNKWIQEYLVAELPQIKLIKPEGTYQIWLDFSELNLSNEALTELIFAKAKLGLAPGVWFGKGSEQFMRINIASPRKVIEEAFYALKREVDLL